MGGGGYFHPYKMDLKSKDFAATKFSISFSLLPLPYLFSNSSSPAAVICQWKGKQTLEQTNAISACFEGKRIPLLGFPRNNQIHCLKF